MTTLKRIVAILSLVLACLVAAPAHAQDPATGSQTQTRPQQQNEFLPLDQLPPQEQLPAPRLLIAAYSFVMAALFLYILSVARRLTTVRREVERLEADLKRSGRA